jgi:NAD(P)-dependent dehydrogenase (short-subunit alcohol dehydrogenase family)
MELPGAVVVVTGASRGIGRATGELLAARGARVVGVARDAAALDRLDAATGGASLAADVADPAAADRIVEHALRSYGRLDGVVVNAGLGHAGDFGEMPPARIAELVDVNLRAALLLARASLPALRARLPGLNPAGHPHPSNPAGHPHPSNPAGHPHPSNPAGHPHPSRGRHGGIVFVGSIAGAVGVPGESVYSATKAALACFADLLREELRADRIGVSTVLPGVVTTDLLHSRGVPYTRRFPRPMPPERAAAAVVRALQTGTPQVFVPRWLALPARLAGTAPGLYRLLARHFG